jgi:uncharacterized protein (DUF58 family)
MTNVETRMTKEARSTNDEAAAGHTTERSDCVSPSSFGLRHLSFSLFRLLAAGRNRPGWGSTAPGGLRPYVPGDDYRQVDWRLCARRDELFTRTCEGAGDAPRYFLLDCSASMALGRPSKFDAARRIAAALGGAALAAGQAIDIRPLAASPRTQRLRLCGKNQALRLRRWLDSLALAPTPIDLGRAMAAAAAGRQQPGPVLLIGDLLDRGGFQRPLEQLQRQGYSPRIVQIYAPEEADPRMLGDVELQDVESSCGSRATLSPRIVARYRELFAEFMKSVRRYAAGHGWQCVQWPSNRALPARGDCKP